MAIAFDAASNGRTGSGTSHTVSHTCSGADRFLLVGVIGDGADKITGVTYNGAAMSLVAKALLGSARWGYLFGLAAPSTGANDIIASASSASFIEICAASYTGVNQTGQPEASATDAGTTGVSSRTSSVTTVTDNAWAVEIAFGQSGTITAGASTTRRTTNLVGAFLDSGGAVTPAGSRALVFNQASSGGVGAVIAAIAPASGGGDTTAPNLTSPTGAATGSTTATVGATTDEGNGTLYAVVTVSGTAPSAAQVKAGQNNSGAAATWSGSVAVSSTGAKTLSATGLTASTAYYAHLMHEDAATNQSTVVSSSQFTTSSAESLTLTTPKQYEVHQRSGSTGSIQISGTVGGSTEDIEASFNGGAYATIASAVAPGSFSGTLTTQGQGQGTLTVRKKTTTSTAATVADVGIGDVFVVGGDSISEGRGTNAQSYAHATLKAGKFTQADAWGNGNDGIDTGTSNGSHWPLLATHIMEDQGVPVAFVSVGTGSTDVAGSANTWAKPGAEYTGLTNQVTDSTVSGVKAVLMHLGPNAVVNASTLSQVTYNAALDTLASNIATDVAGAPKLHIGIFGEVSTGSPPDRRAALNNLRAAIIEAQGDNANVKPGPCLIELNYSDGVHPQSDAHLQAVANRWWIALKESLYSGSGGRGPRFSSASWNGARNQLTVVFDRTLKTGLTHATGAWQVSDNGSAMTVSSIAYHGTNGAALVFTMSAAAVGAANTTTVTFASGDDAVGQVVPMSADITLPGAAGTTQIPAEPFYAQAAGETATTVTLTLTTNGSTPAASLTGLRWAFFDQALPNNFTAPTAKGTGESTDGSGVLSIAITGTSLAPGATGYLVVTDTAGTAGAAQSAYAGPVVVS